MAKINRMHTFNGEPPTQDVRYNKSNCDDDDDYGVEENQPTPKVTQQSPLDQLDNGHIQLTPIIYVRPSIMDFWREYA